MVRRRLSCVASFVAAGAATWSASAYARDDSIRATQVAIVNGHYADAERALTAERRIFPSRADVLLNLAAIYASTGRAPLAASLYNRVLERDDVMMDLSADRIASAHSIARIGLRRLVQTETASR